MNIINTYLFSNNDRSFHPILYFVFNRIDELLSLCHLRNNVKRSSKILFKNLTLIFYISIIYKWSDVPTLYGSKVRFLWDFHSKGQMPKWISMFLNMCYLNFPWALKQQNSHLVCKILMIIKRNKTNTLVLSTGRWT